MSLHIIRIFRFLRDFQIVTLSYIIRISVNELFNKLLIVTIVRVVIGDCVKGRCRPGYARDARRAGTSQNFGVRSGISLALHVSDTIADDY